MTIHNAPRAIKSGIPAALRDGRQVVVRGFASNDSVNVIVRDSGARDTVPYSDLVLDGVPTLDMTPAQMKRLAFVEEELVFRSKHEQAGTTYPGRAIQFPADPWRDREVDPWWVRDNPMDAIEQVVAAVTGLAVLADFDPTDYTGDENPETYRGTWCFVVTRDGDLVTEEFIDARVPAHEAIETVLAAVKENA